MKPYLSEIPLVSTLNNQVAGLHRASPSVALDKEIFNSTDNILSQHFIMSMKNFRKSLIHSEIYWEKW